MGCGQNLESQANQLAFMKPLSYFTLGNICWADEPLGLNYDIRTSKKISKLCWHLAQKNSSASSVEWNCGCVYCRKNRNYQKYMLHSVEARAEYGTIIGQ